jgi:pyruvate dehydrogenase E2 component (dihydrolipoamide acetyltransferase)
MPALGADMERGTLVRWLIKPGDRVKRGDIVAEVETQKGVIDVEIFDSGVVERIVVPAGTEAPVGAVLAFVNGAGTGAGAPAMPPPAAPQPAAPTPTAIPPVPMPPAHPASGRMRISPLARRAAEQFGVDLRQVHGTGPGGAITAEDVQKVATARPATPPGAAPPDRQAGMRAAIAATMSRSKREIPHYYLATEIDMAPALDWLAAENARRPVTARLLVAALLLRAVALAARQVPEVNGFWLDGDFRPSEAVHLGVAIALPKGGLIAPALRDAHALSLDGVMAGLRDLVTRARTGKLRSSEVAGGTITVTSLGEEAVSAPFAVIQPPQVAMVGFGPIRQRPWVVDGAVVARPIIAATLAADHRASVGHRGDRFLATVNRLLQKPEEL